MRFGCAETWPTGIEISQSSWLFLLAVAFVAGASHAFHTCNQLDRGTDAIAQRRPLLASLLIVAALGAVGIRAYLLKSRNMIASTGVYQRADLAYLRGVTMRLIRLGESREKLTESQRDLVDLLNAGLTDWTSRVVAHNIGTRDSVTTKIDLAFQRGALLTLAQDIFPRDAKATVVAQYLSAEAALIQDELSQAHRFRQHLQTREREASQRYQELLDSDENSSPLPPNSAAKAAAELTQLETQSQDVRKQIARLELRQQLRTALGSSPRGLNSEYPWLRLPIQIPGGLWWSWSVSCTSIIVALYLLLGLCVQKTWRIKKTEDWKHKTAFLRMYMRSGSVAMFFLWLVV